MKPLTPELLLAAMDAGHTVQRDQTLPITDWAEGERVAQAIVALRRARGDRPIGWKVGLTNVSAWPRLGIDRPIWGRIYDRTVTLLDGTRAELFLDGLSTPRIEPEIVVGLARTPAADTPLALLEACAWIAHGFEIVHTPYPDWRSAPMESHAAQGMHAALIVGPRLRPDQLADSPAALARALETFTLTMTREGGERWSGHGAVVMGSPLASLGRLVRELAARGEQLGTGDVITTGTVTDAQPLGEPGLWHTELQAIALPGLTLRSQWRS